MSKKLLKSVTTLGMNGKVHVHDELMYFNGEEFVVSRTSTDKLCMGSPISNRHSLAKKNAEKYLEYRYLTWEIVDDINNFVVKEWIVERDPRDLENKMVTKLDAIHTYRVVEGKLYRMNFLSLVEDYTETNIRHGHDGKCVDSLWYLVEHEYDFGWKDKHPKQRYPCTKTIMGRRAKYSNEKNLFADDLISPIIKNHHYASTDDGHMYLVSEDCIFANGYVLKDAIVMTYKVDDKGKVMVRCDEHHDIVPRSIKVKDPDFANPVIKGSFECHTVEPGITEEVRSYEYVHCDDDVWRPTLETITTTNSDIVSQYKTIYNNVTGTVYENHIDNRSLKKDSKPAVYLSKVDPDDDIVKIMKVEKGHNERIAELRTYCLCKAEEERISVTIPDSKYK